MSLRLLNFIKLMSIHLNVIFQWHSFLDTTCQHINLKSDEIKFLGKYEWLIFFKTTSTGQRVLFWYLALLIVEAIDHRKCVVKVSILFSLLFIFFFRQCQNRKTSINDIFVIPFLKLKKIMFYIPIINSYLTIKSILTWPSNLSFN